MERYMVIIPEGKTLEDLQGKVYVVESVLGNRVIVKASPYQVFTLESEGYKVLREVSE